MRQQDYLESAIEQLRENPVDVCVLWPFSTNTHGYGQVSYDGQQSLVHRLAYQLYYEEIPIQCILHKCGNRACYNPEHLYEGNHKQNIRDTINHYGMFPGGQRKLTEEDVTWALVFLRDGRLTHQQIADCLGVSRPVISAINTNRTWKHVPRSPNEVYTQEDHTKKEAIILRVRAKPRPVQKMQPFELNLSDEEIETAKGLLARGFSITEVASWLDISRVKVRVLSNEQE